ncbi:MAG: hypothetical protein HY059_22780 [Proteobacteria bacterium]|nr:hypothetical protein [Pseudomonadota bacterium]
MNSRRNWRAAVSAALIAAFAAVPSSANRAPIETGAPRPLLPGGALFGGVSIIEATRLQGMLGDLNLIAPGITPELRTTIQTLKAIDLGKRPEAASLFAPMAAGLDMPLSKKDAEDENGARAVRNALVLVDAQLQRSRQVAEAEEARVADVQDAARELDALGPFVALYRPKRAKTLERASAKAHARAVEMRGAAAESVVRESEPAGRTSADVVSSLLAPMPDGTVEAEAKRLIKTIREHPVHFESLHTIEADVASAIDLAATSPSRAVQSVIVRGLVEDLPRKKSWTHAKQVLDGLGRVARTTTHETVRELVMDGVETGVLKLKFHNTITQTDDVAFMVGKAAQTARLRERAKAYLRERDHRSGARDNLAGLEALPPLPESPAAPAAASLAAAETELPPQPAFAVPLPGASAAKWTLDAITGAGLRAAEETKGLRYHLDLGTGRIFRALQYQFPNPDVIADHPRVGPGSRVKMFEHEKGPIGMAAAGTVFLVPVVVNTGSGHSHLEPVPQGVLETAARALMAEAGIDRDSALKRIAAAGALAARETLEDLRLELEYRIKKPFLDAKLDAHGLVELDAHGAPHRETWLLAQRAVRFLDADPYGFVAADVDRDILARLKGARERTRERLLTGRNDKLKTTWFEENIPVAANMPLIDYVRTERFKLLSWWVRSDENDRYTNITAETSRSPFLKRLGRGAFSRIYWAKTKDGFFDVEGPRFRVNLDASGQERSLELLAPLNRPLFGRVKWGAFLFERIGDEWVPVDTSRLPEDMKCIRCHHGEGQSAKELHPLPEQVRTEQALRDAGYRDDRLIEEYLTHLMP